MGGAGQGEPVCSAHTVIRAQGTVYTGTFRSRVRDLREGGGGGRGGSVDKISETSFETDRQRELLLRQCLLGSMY